MLHRSLSLGRPDRLGFEHQHPADIARSMVDTSGTAAAAAPNHAVDFRHLECGSSEVDRLMDNAGGFGSFGEYVLLEAAFQRSGNGFQSDLSRLLEYEERDRTGVQRSSGHEKVLRWRSAANKYRRWAADQIYPSVRRAINSADGMLEQHDPDGGAVVPSHMIMEVWDKARAAPSPFRMAKVVVVPTVAGMLPGIYETSRVTGSRWGGLTANWLTEGQQVPTTIPLLQSTEYRLKKLAILIPFTDELLQDSSMLDSYLTETASKELEFQIVQAMLTGTGGQPNGMANGPATITVAADQGQAANTITASNIQNMWARMWAPSRANAAWWSNTEWDPDSLALPTSNMTGWNGPQPSATIKGRPVWPLEQSSAIGQLGDVLLADPSQYLLTMMGIRKSISAYLRFQYGETYMKLILRVDGQSLWMNPVTPTWGTATKSPFVVIATR